MYFVFIAFKMKCISPIRVVYP